MILGSCVAMGVELVMGLLIFADIGIILGSCVAVLGILDHDVAVLNSDVIEMGQSMGILDHDASVRSLTTSRWTRQWACSIMTS